MKTIFSMLLLSVSFQLNIATAVENIIGTWQGDLSLGSGQKVTLQFLIQKDIDDTYSVALSLPDKAGTGDIEASQVVFRSGKLTFEVPELSGSYEGILKDNEIVGVWKQKGGSIPLILSRFELLPLSDEDKEKLMGKWHRKTDCHAGAIGYLAVYYFEFEVDEGQNFTGAIRIYHPDGELDPLLHKITEMGKNGDSFIFKAPSMGSEFRGRYVDNEIVGEFKQLGWPHPFTLKKGEYIHNLNTKLDLPDNVVELLSGEWSGKVDYFLMVFEFEKTETGDLQGHIVSRDQLDNVFPITEAIMNNGQLILKTEDFEVQFEMQLSSDTLTGEWTQCGVSYPLSIVKEGI